ncbi:MAG: hypothetical protein R6U87_00005, partial [Thiohalospira sp.]
HLTTQHLVWRREQRYPHRSRKGHFSCVVQKHVVFHDTPDHSDFVEAGDNLHVRASAVESDICTPEEFAASHPARRELDSAAAMRMVPRSLWLDYRRGAWTGEMAVGAKT